MGAPMIPSPTKPTFMCVLAILLNETFDRHVLRRPGTLSR